MENHSKIEEFLDRGVERIYPSKEFLKEKLESGQKLTMYLGIDPTGPSLHLGHSVSLLKLSDFQKLGHKAILLVGDFTATIGDPTDKMAPRVSLTRKEVLRNARLYKKQAARLLKFGGQNPATLRYNSKWLSKLSMADSAKLLSHVTYAQTIKRDMFQRRIAEGKDLYVSEFLYPLLQGYDSVAMAVDGEVGGNDQTFNMLMGRDLMKKLKNKEKFVIAMKLLTDPSGQKMGKTEGNMAALNEKPPEMFGKIMSWPDGSILPAFELCTRTPLSGVAQMKSDLENGVNPKDLKLRLAETIVSMYHSDRKAKRAKESFLKTFSRGEIPADIPEFKSFHGALLSDCLISAGVIASKSEWRRLVGEKAVKVVSAGGSAGKIMDFNFKINSPAVFKIGKRRFLRIVL